MFSCCLPSNPLSQGFHSGTHWLFLHCAEQKHWHEPLAVFPSSALSVRRGHRRPLGSWTFLFSATRVGRERDCQFWAELRLNNALLYQHLFLSVCPQQPPHHHPSPIPALFCCFNHFYHGPISSMKSRALHLLRTVTSGFSDVSQSQHYHSCFSCARQVFRCRSSIEPLALFRALHSEPIFWPRYMYSKRHLFSRRRMTVPHYSVLKTFARIKLIYIKCIPYFAKIIFQILLTQMKPEQENIIFGLNQFCHLSQFAYNFPLDWHQLYDIQLTVCRNCVTQPWGTKPKVSGVYGSSALWIDLRRMGVVLQDVSAP